MDQNYINEYLASVNGDSSLTNDSKALIAKHINGLFAFAQSRRNQETKKENYPSNSPQFTSATPQPNPAAPQVNPTPSSYQSNPNQINPAPNYQPAPAPRKF